MPRTFTPPVLFFLLALLPHWAAAQDIRHVRGQSEVVVDEFTSMAQAKLRAEAAAKQDAMAKSFGTSVVRGSQMTLDNQTSGETQSTTNSRFKLLADTYAKADWLQTTQIDFKVEEQKQGKSLQKILLCSIEGKARALTKAPIGWKAQSLACPSPSCAQTQFVKGDRFYLGFESPAAGYVMVFLDDRLTAVQRLLPYTQPGPLADQGVQVGAGKWYCFFSDKAEHRLSTDASYQTDELALSCETCPSVERMYVLFSPKPLPVPQLQAAASTGLYTTPAGLSSEDFARWLGQVRSADPSIELQAIDLLIAESRR